MGWYSTAVCTHCGFEQRAETTRGGSFIRSPGWSKAAEKTTLLTTRNNDNSDATDFIAGQYWYYCPTCTEQIIDLFLPKNEHEPTRKFDLGANL